ncbi:hypothetical protein FGIG_10902 [Fasciola gigantica]|uniref:Uncharacterized protein n=1 Tax=Fasciola gigantica TaxID=46835 RepID=A0A504YFC5_FASGI|nr:hypothetical protein FGIG_10902 [Fasciola gigantica]
MLTEGSLYIPEDVSHCHRSTPKTQYPRGVFFPTPSTSMDPTLKIHLRQLRWIPQ